MFLQMQNSNLAESGDKFERNLSYYDISSDDLKLNLVNEDLINISSSPKVLSRSVELTGEFTRPGVYAFEPGKQFLMLSTGQGVSLKKVMRKVRSLFASLWLFHRRKVLKDLQTS